MITLNTLQKMKRNGEKITMLTCYDASFSTLLNAAGVEIFLVGDSLGMVVQGHTSTLPVTLEDIIYHTKAVTRGNSQALLVADLPFGSYETTPEAAYNHAVQLMKAGAHMVKLEGGEAQVDKTDYLTKRSIPVCAHLGLTPQAVNVLGGYRIQGRKEEAAKQIMKDALAHEKAGASLLVLECVPQDLAAEISQKLTIPTIGIGAGKDCDGQVLVLHDMLGVYANPPSFVKNFLSGQESISEAIKAYVREVKAEDFPGPEHSFN